MEPLTGQPAPTAASPAPPPTPSPAPQPAPATSQPAPQPAPTPASGPGSSGTPGSGTPNPTPAAPITPAPQPADFEQQFRQRYGMSPDQAQVLMTLGYRTYQQPNGQPAPQPQPAQPAAQANPFGLPQFDMNLLNFVERGADGRLQLVAGAPPDAAIRVQEYQDKLRTVQQQFWADPAKFLGPMIQQQAQQIAQQVFQNQFQQTQHQQFARQTLEQNSQWLYERDAAGQTQRQFNPATGQSEPVLSAAGRAYRQLVIQAHQAGIQDPTQQHQYAVMGLQNHLLQARVQQLTAGQQQQQANGQFLQQAAQQTPPPAANLNPAQPPVQPMKTLREAMLERMNQNGLTDEMVRQQLANPRAA